MLRRTVMFKPVMFEITIYVELSKREFQDIVDRNCIYKTISDGIEIIFVSKLKEMTLQHYMKQPRSMLCRKPKRKYDRDFEYNFLPYCLSTIAFTHIITLMDDIILIYINGDKKRYIKFL